LKTKKVLLYLNKNPKKNLKKKATKFWSMLFFLYLCTRIRDCAG
jgi:hypothetical protein